jgi:hypothetical protein
VPLRLLWIVVVGISLIGLGQAVAPARGQGSSPQREPEPISLSGGPAFPLARHLESKDIAAGAMSIQELFDAGDELFHTDYNDEDGIGSLRLPDGSPTLRFSNIPPGGGARMAVSSESCGRCHVGTASGPSQANVAFDPGQDGTPPYRIRNTTSLFGNGILQLLAQEMTEDLQAVRDGAEATAKQQPGQRVERSLTSKGVDFGTVAATSDAQGTVTLDVSGVRGVDPDLVVRPMGWKGHITTVRVITAGAAAAVMGLLPEEVVWKMQERGAEGDDPDGDGVERELSVGDVTAMVVYGTAQETPTSVERLAELGLAAPPSAADRARIEQGRGLFDEVGCASCHTPSLRLQHTVFEEPTLRGNGHYYDKFLTAKDEGYDTARPVRFDILRDAQEPRAESHPDGGAVILAYGDLKRHRMGRQLTDPGGPQPASNASGAPATFDDQPILIPADEYLTPELWGVGNTGPWMHDGRAAGLREAILWHGEDSPPPLGDPGRSEAQESREAFAALADEDQQALLVFLRSLRTYSRDTGQP